MSRDNDDEDAVAMSLEDDSDDDDDDDDDSTDSSDSDSSDSDDDDDDDDDDESFDDPSAGTSGASKAVAVKLEDGPSTNSAGTNGAASNQDQSSPTVPIESAAAPSVAPATTSVLVKKEESISRESDAHPSVAVKTEAPSAESNGDNGTKTTNGIARIIADEKKQEANTVNDETMEDVGVKHATTEASDAVMTEAQSPSIEMKPQPTSSIGTLPLKDKEHMSSTASSGLSSPVAASDGTKPKPKLKIKLRLGKAATAGTNATPSSPGLAAIKAEPSSTATTNKIVAENGATDKVTEASSTTNNGEPPPKKKKLSIVLKTKAPLTEKEASAGSTSTPVVKAEVVDDDDGKADDVVAKVIDNPTAKTSTGGASTATTTKPKKKVPSLFIPGRLPPFTSPGMYRSHYVSGSSQASSALFRSAMDKKTCLALPSVLFEQSMASVGYTTEERTKNPHRGSSVRKTVGDMFDSDVILTARFPELIPAELWNAPVAQEEPQSVGQEQSHTSAGEGPVKAGGKLTLPDLLMKSLKGDREEIEETDPPLKENDRDRGGRKRTRPLEFKDMLPVSLTLPYPDTYLGQYQEYVKKVQERERAIVMHQEAQEKLEVEQEEREFLYGKPELSGEVPKPSISVAIPPIPSVPTPPLLSELQGFDTEQYEDKYPSYFPKGKTSFVAHLDPTCFHITEGRYFGLNSNMIADPQFVGASAPGLIGQTLTPSSGLATASSTSNGTVALLAVPIPAASLNTSSGQKSSSKSKKKSSSASKSDKKNSSAQASVKPDPKTKISLKRSGLVPTATMSDLRKVIEKNDEMAAKIKDCIIRAAIRACRGEKDGPAFLAPDGNIYPDATKAFSAYGGTKPCKRCKGNKQGAYHCRLRRKHQEADYDGGHSSSELAALLALPKEELLLKPKDLDAS